MKIKIKLAHVNAKVPTYAHISDGCFDLYAADKVYDPANNMIEYDTGVVFEIPDDHVGLVFMRSSVCKTPHLLRNGVGVIDSSYRSTVKFKFLAVSPNPEQYEVGNRVGQMMIIPRPKIEFDVADELTEGERGESGFGGSGK